MYECYNYTKKDITVIDSKGSVVIAPGKEVCVDIKPNKLGLSIKQMKKEEKKKVSKNIKNIKKINKLEDD